MRCLSFRVFWNTYNVTVFSDIGRSHMMEKCSELLTRVGSLPLAGDCSAFLME